MNSCEYYAELISRMIDGELTDGELYEVRGHIASCPDCRAMYEAFSAVSGAIAEDMQDAPEALSANVMAYVRRDAIIKKNTRKKHVIRRVLTAAACFVLVFAAAYTVETRIAAPAEAPMAAEALDTVTNRKFMQSAPKEMPAEAPAAPAPKPEECPAEAETAVESAESKVFSDAPTAADGAAADNGAGAIETYRLSPWQFEMLCELLGDAQFTADCKPDTVCRFVSNAGDVCTVYYDGLVLYFGMNENEKLSPAACSLEDIQSFIAEL